MAACSCASAVHRRGPAARRPDRRHLDCGEAVFSNPDGAALNAGALVVGTSLFLRKAQCTGEVQLSGAQIKGPLNCAGAVFTNPDGIALNAYGLLVEANMSLRKVQCHRPGAPAQRSHQRPAGLHRGGVRQPRR